MARKKEGEGKKKEKEKKEKEKKREKGEKEKKRGWKGLFANNRKARRVAAKMQGVGKEKRQGGKPGKP